MCLGWQRSLRLYPWKVLRPDNEAAVVGTSLDRLAHLESYPERRWELAAEAVEVTRIQRMGWLLRTAWPAAGLSALSSILAFGAVAVFSPLPLVATLALFCALYTATAAAFLLVLLPPLLVLRARLTAGRQGCCCCLGPPVEKMADLPLAGPEVYPLYPHTKDANRPPITPPYTPRTAIHGASRPSELFALQEAAPVSPAARLHKTLVQMKAIEALATGPGRPSAPRRLLARLSNFRHQYRRRGGNGCCQRMYTAGITSRLKYVLPPTVVAVAALICYFGLSTVQPAEEEMHAAILPRCAASSSI